MEIYRLREPFQQDVAHILYGKAVRFLERSGISVVETNNCDFAGESFGDEILLRNQQSPIHKFITLIHEATHELLHRDAEGTLIEVPFRARETQAEAVGCNVLHNFGFNLSLDSTRFIVEHGDISVLARDRQLIQNTANYFVRKIREL